jgi:hypothetical protein
MGTFHGFLWCLVYGTNSVCTEATNSTPVNNQTDSAADDKAEDRDEDKVGEDAEVDSNVAFENL